MALAAAKRTTYSIYSIEVNIYIYIYIYKAILSHSGRLAFSLPNSPNETSFTHLVDDPERLNLLQEKDFLILPTSLAVSWTTTLKTLPIQQKLQLKKLLLISKLSLMKEDMDQSTWFPLELIEASESKQIFASLSTIIHTQFFSRAI